MLAPPSTGSITQNFFFLPIDLTDFPQEAHGHHLDKSELNISQNPESEPRNPYLDVNMRRLPCTTAILCRRPRHSLLAGWMARRR